MNRFLRVLRRDPLERKVQARPMHAPFKGGPALFHPRADAIITKPVTVLDPSTNEQVVFPSDTTAMPVPRRMHSRDAIVTGDEVEYGNRSGMGVTEKMPTMRLVNFAVGDWCLMPSRETRMGRTCWVKVRVWAV